MGHREKVRERGRALGFGNINSFSQENWEVDIKDVRFFFFFWGVGGDSGGFKIDHEFRGWHLLVKILLQFLRSLFYNTFTISTWSEKLNIFLFNNLVMSLMTHIIRFIPQRSDLLNEDK